jgi:hypothetical protein
MRHHPGARAITTTLARAAVAVAAAAGFVVVAVAASPVPADASGIVPPTDPSVNVPPQVMPRCTTVSVDDTSAACINSVLHNINYARSLENLGPLVLPSTYAGDTVAEQQLILTDEERGDRGLSQFSGLDPALNVAALVGATGNTDPQPPSGYPYANAGSIFAVDYTPLGADFAWMYNDGYGGTNALCTSLGDSNCWGHRDQILGSWTTGSGVTAQMGDGDTAAGRYAQIFANQSGTAHSLTDTLVPSDLPTDATPAAPDVVQVLPASTSNTAAGTPVTIEGNYFTTSPVPQVFFGGVPATNVHVNWNGELSADAPADPAGASTDQVVVTVTTSGGSSTGTVTSQVNEFTYAPANAPTISSISPASGAQIPIGSITIHGSNFFSGGTPIVDFGPVASIGTMTYTSTSITATIPSSVSPGTFNVTVTTNTGTSAVSAADLYAYTGSGSSAAPAIASVSSATFANGSQNVFDVTTTGAPNVSSISDAAFGGCTPSILPPSIKLLYGGSARATLAGNPQPGDGGVYSLCMQAGNGIGSVATQQFTLTLVAPPAPPPPPAPAPPAAASHGYWLVGSDGGIFTFGSAQFYGSTGSLHLQRPVTGITPTADRGGYWLVASDGGIFAFGGAGFHGSIPGAGLSPAGSGHAHSLNAPIVGMVPSNDGAGYFMVASDGGVFAFGDAKFEGSCPGIGGCSGHAVAVVPDATGNGYWVVTDTGSVYTFGDAANYGAPGPQASGITSAVATPNGGGYWVLDAAGQVFPFGNAAGMGSLPPGSAGGFDPASAIFETSDGEGYWVVTGLGQVTAFGDAPADGDMSATHLNGSIIAASGS